jgi:hypothetical protein
MWRRSLFVGAALACWAATLGQAAPPPDRPPPPPDRPPGADVRAGHALRAKNVMGAKVSLKGDLAIGTVDDIIFSDDGTIDYLVVLNEGKYVTVPWEAAKFDFDKRTAVVEITQDQFKEIPTYTAEKYPDFYEPVYREKIYKFYNVKPRREIRREERRP